MHLKSYIIALFFGFLSGISTWAQTNFIEPLPRHLKEVGYPFVQNYSPEEYNASDQNWEFVQDSLGIIYVGNGSGVLTFDGVNWDLLELPNSAAVLSLAIDKNNRVYVGALQELGYLQPDSMGKLEYISLKSHLPDKEKGFNIVREIFIADEGIYFRASKKLFLWNGIEFKIWSTEKNVPIGGFYVYDTLFLYNRDKGLMKMNLGKFELVPNGEKFIEDRIRFMLPFNKAGNKQILIGTSDSLYTYDGTDFLSFATNRPEFFQNNRIYEGIQLNDGTYALGSSLKGILIIDNKGRQRARIPRNEYLRSTGIESLFQDRSGILWASLFSGLAKIEYPSPFSLFENFDESQPVVLDILRYKGRIYAGTHDGLFLLKNDEKKYEPKFVGFPEFPKNDVALMVFNDRLLACSSMGLFQIDENKKISLLVDDNAVCMKRSVIDKNRVYLSTHSGLISVYNMGETWKIENNVGGITHPVYLIQEDPKGNLWLKTNTNEVIKVSIDYKNNLPDLNAAKSKTYGFEDGLGNEIGIPHIVKKQVYFVESSGKALLFDEKEDKFTFDNTLNKTLGLENEKVKMLSADKDGNVWLIQFKDGEEFDQILAIPQKDGSYVTEFLGESRIMNLKERRFFAELSDSVVWYAGASNRVIRHNLRTNMNEKRGISRAVIRKVRYKNDSILFGGFGNPIKPQIPFKNNQFRFQYANPSFYNEKENQFQYNLEGFDEKWSNWSSETQKDYTNIPRGEYTFKVRSKNIYGQISNEDSYTFKILPPWYRTWWAYLSYFLAAALVVWLLLQWRSEQLRKENLALETLVDERTEEIRKKNKLLGYQTDRLKELDTMKTRLFANISHEFRTPLTLIKGPIEKLESAEENTISTPNIKMIRRNANRLLNLVNQLLDLSKLDSGKLKLNEAEGDVLKCIRAAASSFSSHAASRQMDYQIKVPSRLLWASFDRDKLEKIIYNLLSNAFKFSHDEGQVIIEAEFRSGRLHLKISDRGSGISAKKLPHVFDRFFQVDDSYTREKAGSGIGLALTKELTELMSGTIFVESDLGRGTLFRVVIPLEEIKSGKIHKTVQEQTVNVFEDTPKRPEATASEDKKVKVLIIEDNNDMRHFIKEQLESYYGILEARNGREGLKMAYKMIPDLIVTDLMMPKMDGITLCKKLKTDIATSHIPIIMLTAKAGVENKLEGLETGADDYLTKPFNAQELQVRSRNLIAQRRQLRELFSNNTSLDPKDITVTSLDEEFLQKLLALLEEKYADSEFGVPQIQKELGMGKTRLHAKVKALTNHPPGELLRNFRLKRAAQLLLQKRDNISQTAYDVGFNSLSYFTRCFKELHGMSPSEYIQKYS